MTRSQKVFCVLVLLSLPGCARVTPGRVNLDRIDYGQVIAESWKRQTLLNVVRMRYADAPVFLDVSSVASPPHRNKILIGSSGVLAGALALALAAPAAAGGDVTLHEIRPDVREEVVRKAYQALKKDGHLLVLDFPYPSKLEDFRNPAFDFGIGDQFFECFSGFYHLDNEKQNEVITNAGFTNIQRMRIGRGMFDFITAIKS